MLCAISELMSPASYRSIKRELTNLSVLLSPATSLSNLAINSFANFSVNRAKQFVPCNHDGYVGSGIDQVCGRQKES